MKVDVLPAIAAGIGGAALGFLFMWSLLSHVSPPPPPVHPYSATVVTLCGGKYGVLVTDTSGELSYYRDPADPKFQEDLARIPRDHRWQFVITPRGGCPRTV